jgi:DNA-binding transcriptional ArsR family regulator
VQVFAALADPVRREIVELLTEGPIGAGVIAERFPVSRPAVSRHLRVLREAGLVRSETAAQQRVYHLERAALVELDRWLERFRPLSVAAGGPAARLAALDTELHRGRRARRDNDNDEDKDTVEVDDRDAG